MNGLSVEDREDLVNALLSTTDGFHRSLRVAGGEEEPLADVVEEIVARHVEAFREQAAAELDRRASGGTAFNAAARVVRNLPR